MTPKNDNKPLVAGVVIKQNGKYLLVQEKQEDAYGLWNWPAGHVDAGETIEAGAVREAREETGYQVRLLGKIGTFDAGKHSKHVFGAEIVGGEISFPAEEILDVRWFSGEEIRSMKEKLRSDWILGALDVLESE